MSLSERLQDPTLLESQAYINGWWVDGDSGETFPANDPATTECGYLSD